MRLINAFLFAFFVHSCYGFVTTSTESGAPVFFLANFLIFAAYTAIYAFTLWFLWDKHWVSGPEALRSHAGKDPKRVLSTESPSVVNHTAPRDFDNVAHMLKTKRTNTSTIDSKKSSQEPSRDLSKKTKRTNTSTIDSKKSSQEPSRDPSKSLFSSRKSQKAWSEKEYTARSDDTLRSDEVTWTPGRVRAEKARASRTEFFFAFIVCSVVYASVMSIHIIVDTIIVLVEMA
uniref:Uncharacterized protein n=1 Tax=Steinernema glaseri TaxID=37863 RepID=A0A1I7Z581_9BILA